MERRGANDRIERGGEVVVIGGGVVGLSLARELAARHRGVTLLERRRLATGGGDGAATDAALGVLHAAPDRGSPLSRLLILGHRSYPELASSLERETGVDIGYRSCGGLHLERVLPRAAVRRRRAAALERAGYAGRWLAREEIERLSPGTAPELRAAFHVPAEGVVRPRELRRALVASCRRRGVVIEEDAGDVRVLPGASPRVLLADARVIAPKACVVAAGSRTPAVLGESLSLRSIEPVRGQAIAVRARRPPGPCLRARSCRTQREYHVVSREDGTSWVGSTVEEVGHDGSTTTDGAAELVAFLEELYPLDPAPEILDHWAGLRPRAGRRGGPFLGPVPGCPGVWIAAGHYRSGISSGPYSAKLLAAAMAEAIDSPRPALVLREDERALLEAFRLPG